MEPQRSLHLLTHWYLLHPQLDQELHLCEKSAVFYLDRLLTVAVNDIDQTIRSMVAVPSQRSGLVLASHVPRDGTRVLASLKPTVGTFARLRIDHLDYLAYCSFCLASFQRFTRLLDLRAVIRFFFLASCRSALSPAVGPLCPAVVALLPAVAYVHHPSLIDLRPAPAPGRSL